eukprot:Anaeramoba_flamelloidesa814411_111.p1 GENE.a814411_111~~a814411_111.p1  ORF type:complete len:433 (-),score=35.06 a814411_111:181-1479(-)
MDHIKKGTLVLDEIQTIVLDEADEMLRMGFIDDVEWILGHTPSERRVALFSATMPKEIRKIANKYLKDPAEVTIKMKVTTAETIRQRYWMVSGYHKVDALTRILEVEKYDGVIIFVRTKSETTDLAEKLSARGYAACGLNGDMNQAQREKTVNRLKKGQLDILIGTDIVARGLDIDRITHVINYDIPYDTESYVHRIGRTGRAGKQGEAILFVSPRERNLLNMIERATKKKIERMELPSTEDVNDTRVARFKQQITDVIANAELEKYLEVVESYQNEHNVPAIEIAAALAKISRASDPLFLTHKKVKVVEENSSAPATKEGFSRYRISVGNKDRIKVGNIVAALANEGEVDTNDISKITIYDTYSTVDLPENMSAEQREKIGAIKVAGRKLSIKDYDDRESRSSNRSDGGRGKSRGRRRPGRDRDRSRRSRN